MILDINVLDTLMVLGVFDEGQAGLVVVKQLYGLVISLPKEQFFKPACGSHHGLSSLCQSHIFGLSGRRSDPTLFLADSNVCFVFIKENVTVG